jgi:biotin carboxylase
MRFRTLRALDYPSALPEDVQRRMADIAATVMPGLGFDNGLFNIEMMYDPESDVISIIEINPRMASQFADLYEKVDGTNSYAVLLDIALGRAPQFTRRQGRYAFASSIVLRSFEDSASSPCRPKPILAASPAMTPTPGSRSSRRLAARSHRKCRMVTATATESLLSGGATAPMCLHDSRPSGTGSASCSSRWISRGGKAL